MRLQGKARVIPNTQYLITGFGPYTDDVVVHCYNEMGLVLSDGAILNVRNGAQGRYFTTPSTGYYIRYSIDGVDLEDFNLSTSEPCIACAYRDRVAIEDRNYQVLDSAYVTREGENIGILALIRRFLTLADGTYGTAYDGVKAAQKVIKDAETAMIEQMGDLFREGYWQDDNYVDGDEERLYDDALDNLEKIAFPETTYQIGFLDLYDANTGAEYGVVPDTIAVPWPDISIASAAHLVDEEIGVNTWGFIDKIQKCYDKPWTTTISINTNLTTLAQHTFADVMSNIAKVSNTVNGRISRYDTTSARAVTYSEYDDLLSNLVTLTKVTEKVGGRVTEMENAITNQRSTLTQAANMLASEITRAVNSEQTLSSQIVQTENSIRTAVSDVTQQAVSDMMDDMGLKPYTVSIDCASGSFITEDIQSLTLQAVVRKGQGQANLIDVPGLSPAVSSENITWQKRGIVNGEDGWIPVPAGDGQASLTVTSENVGDQATYRMTINIDGEDYYATFTAANIAKINQLELYLASSQPAVQTLTLGATGGYAPDWSRTPLKLIPSLYFNGSSIPTDDPDVTCVWYKSIDGGTWIALSSSLTEQVATQKRVAQSDADAYGTLTVSGNVIESSSVGYQCVVTYMGGTIRAEKIFSLIRNEPSSESCEITGTHVFRYDSSGVPMYSTIDLLANVNGCSVTDWLYWNPAGEGAWVSLVDASVITSQQRTANAQVISEDDPIFYAESGISRARIMVTTTTGDGDEGPSDVFTIYKTQDGTENPLVFLTNDHITFVADMNGKVAAGTEKTLYIAAYLGSTKVVPTYRQSGTLPNASVGISVGSPVNMELPVTVSILENTNLGSANACSGTIDLYVDTPEVATLTIEWNKILTGQPGAGIESMVTYYTKSPRAASPNADEFGTTMLNNQNILSVFDSNGELNGDPVLNQMVLGASSLWSTSAPGIEAVERYLWSYDVVTYTDRDEPVVTAQRVVGVYGDVGTNALSYGLHTPLGEVFKQNTDHLDIQAYAYSGTDDMLPVCSFVWDYYRNGEWVRIADAVSSSCNLTGSWLRANCAGGASLRCTITYNGTPYYAYCNLIDKTDNYLAVIACSGGSALYEVGATATLRCRLYQNGTEVDADGSAFQYNWTRLDETGARMEESFKTGKQIVVTAGTDVVGTTTFVCYAQSSDGNYGTQGQYTIDFQHGVVYSYDEPTNPSMNMLWMDTGDEDFNVLRRWNGENWVDVSISQERLEGIKTMLSDHQSAIDQLAEQISLRVTEIDATKDDLNNFIEKTYSSDLSITAKKIEATVSEVENLPAIKNFDYQTRAITSWMRFDINGLELGKNVSYDGVEDYEESKFTARLSPQELGFYEGGDKVAYFGGNSMYITKARVTNELNVGSQRADMPGWFTTKMESDGMNIGWAADSFVKYKFQAKLEYGEQNDGIFAPYAISDYPRCFRFVIRRTNSAFEPLTSARTAFNDYAENYASGDIFFDAITFDEEGDYYYTIQQDGNVYGDTMDPIRRTGFVTFDRTVYYVHVRIARENARYGLEVVTVEVKDSADDAVAFQDLIDTNGNFYMTFRNVYTASEAS